MRESGLTVIDIRNVHRAIIREIEIMAFEQWQRTPDPEDERIKAKITAILHD